MMIRLFRTFIMLLVCFWLPALAVTPSKSEMASFNHWFKTAFLDEGSAPFSFVYGGFPSRVIITNWRKTVSSQAIDREQTRWLICYDEPGDKLRISCEATVYKDYPALDWVVHITNRGQSDTPILEQIQAMDLKWQPATAGDFVLHCSQGDYNSAASFFPLDKPMPRDSLFLFQPIGGRSSDGWMPFFNINNHEQGMVTAVGWTGQWQASFTNLSGKAVAGAAGMEWTWLRLHAGETIRTPRMVVLLWQGVDHLRGNNLFRQLLIKHYNPQRNGQPVFSPICASVDYVDPDGSYEGPHVRVMPELAKRGIEVFWSDMDPQQWYPNGFPDGTGTWLPDPVKYPNGLAPIGEAARQNGLGYLLWFEPERVAPGSYIDQVHPEWITSVPGQRYKLYKLHDPQARAWLTDYIDQQITLAGLNWLRWDFNIEPLKFWQNCDAVDRQGMTEIRHVEGLYAMWDELLRRHPGLIVDNCASGGRRLDIETYRRGLPLWHSDMQCAGSNPDAEQLQNGGLFRWLPMHGCGNFGYEPSYQFRSAMTSGNILVGHSVEWLGRQHGENEKALQEKLGLIPSSWYVSGPYVNPGGAVFTFPFAPERGADLNERDADGSLLWQARQEWQDAEAHYFNEKVQGAFYLYRTVYSSHEQDVPVLLGSDDAIHCWLNERLVFVHHIDRAVTSGLDTTRLHLRQGDNALLIKITNKGGHSGFYFSLTPQDPRYGRLDTAFPETEQEVTRTVALYKKIRPFMLGDFYPLFAHDENNLTWYGYQFHRADSHSGVIVLFRRALAEKTKQIVLHDVATGERLTVQSENDGSIIETRGPSFSVSITKAPGSEILFYQIKR